MIINPKALLRPPPPPVEAPPPRQSGRTKQRESVSGAEDASELPEVSGAEVKSRHFGKSRVPQALRKQQDAQAHPMNADLAQTGSDVDMLDDSQVASPIDVSEQEHEEEIARGIEAKLREKGDPLATSPMRADVRFAAAELAPTSRAPSSQPEPAQMQVDPAPLASTAPSEPNAMVDEEDPVNSDEDIVIQSQRGTLEGGGRDYHSSGSPKHKRWTDNAQEESLSPMGRAGSPDITIMQFPAARSSPPVDHGPIDSRMSVKPGGGLPEQKLSPTRKAVLANELFPTTGVTSAVPPNTADDDDDDVMVVTKAHEPLANPAVGGHSAGAPSTSQTTTSSSAQRPQILTPQDPEPDRQQQLERERIEEELRKKQQEEAELAAREQRKQQALRDAREAVDMDGYVQRPNRVCPIADASEP